MDEPRTHVIYCHDFWHRWMLAREASLPRISRTAALGVIAAITALRGSSIF
jgi:hypothetical protein